MPILEFLFALLLPYQDLPRLTFLGFELRYSMLLIPFLGVYFLKKWREGAITLKPLERKVLIVALALGLYLIAHTLLLGTRTRAVGFIIWYFVNVFALAYAFLIRSEWIARGYFASIVVGCVHILIQRYNPFFLIEPIRILALVDYLAHIRLFSWFGEPSFACLNILFLLSYTFLKDGMKHLSLSILGIAALFLTYSRMGIGGLLVLAALTCYFDFKNKKLRTNTIAMLATVLLSHLCMNVWFVHSYQRPMMQNLVSHDPRFAEIASHIKNKINGNDQEHVNLRKIALIRGLVVIQQHPILGVGFGNSKAYIMENKIRNEFRGFYEGLHNLFQEIWAEVGIIGLLIYLLFLWSLVPIVYWKNTVSPFLFVLFYPMQFCQNINMPVLWLGLIACYFVHIQRRELV